MGLFDDIPTVKAGGLFDDIPAAKPGVLEDVGKSAVGGVVRGVAALPGLPGTVLGFMDNATAELARQTAGRLRTGYDTGGASWAAPAERAAPPQAFSPQALLPTSDQTIKAAEGVIGETYRPQTMPGRYAAAFGEMLPAVAAGSAGVLPKVAAAAVPAALSETAGHLTEGTPWEAPARVAGALAGGVGTAVAARPTTVQRQVSEAMRGVDDAALASAGRLMEDARQTGVPLTWPEAIQHASNGATRLPDLQRVVEQSRTGGPELRTFYAERPAQVETAGRGQMEALAPSPLDPVNTGLRVQKAAEETLRDTERARTNATRPFYNAARNDALAGDEVSQLIADMDRAIAADKTGVLSREIKHFRDMIIDRPAVPEVPGTPAVRTPVLGPQGQVLRYEATPATPGIPAQPIEPVMDIENLSRARRAMRERLDMPLAPGRDPITREQAGAVAPFMERLNGLMEVTSPEYAAGNKIYGDITRNLVQPTAAGPSGALASKEDVVQQARALFPQNPASNSDAIIAQTVRNIVRRDPEAAQSLVRQHAETVFNEAIQNNAGGPNQWGGAKFASVIAGNPQQARNLEASVKALPNGQVRWDGFRRFLDVMEATGRRLQPGSPTAPILETQKEMARGGLKGEAAALALGGGVKLPHRLYEASQRYFTGRANAEMADLFTNPQALPIFQRLLREPADSARAQALALRLTFLGSGGSARAP